MGLNKSNFITLVLRQVSQINIVMDNDDDGILINETDCEHDHIYSFKNTSPKTMHTNHYNTREYINIDWSIKQVES